MDRAKLQPAWSATTLVYTDGHKNGAGGGVIAIVYSVIILRRPNNLLFYWQMGYCCCILQPPYQYMKTRLLYLLLLFSFACVQRTAAQTTTGRVVINEYMPWTSNGCGATAEFIELLNFGPGPVDISCYVLTDGDYSITIPPGTILLPNQFYVVAGQSFIPSPCANIDSGINVNLNWNACGNCTSAPIPTTGEGLFTDGGSANEQVVLLHRNGSVVDAVVRNFPVEPSDNITTSTVGGCTAQTFDLDNLPINYETIGESAGRGNSFARRVDGDCEWIKTPQQSAGATNNKPGNISEVGYSLTLVNPMSCFNDGSIAINVIGGDENIIFPMSWILVYDQNSNNVFDLNDVYREGVDYTPRIVEVDNLGPGTYRITVASQKGCYLQNFTFTILPCQPPLKAVLTDFNLLQQSGGVLKFGAGIHYAEDVVSVVLESSADAATFTQVAAAGNNNFEGYHQWLFNTAAPGPYFRLKFITRSGAALYSAIINVKTENRSINRLWPNPAKDGVQLQYFSATAQNMPFQIINMQGQTVQQGSLPVRAGLNMLRWNIGALPAGNYNLVLPGSGQLLPLRFVKQ